MEVVLLFLMVIGLMLIGVPIAISLGLSSTLFLLWYSDTSLASIAQTLYQAMEGHATLLAIPFFILASSFMSTGGVAKRIIRFAIACVGHLPGGRVGFWRKDMDAIAKRPCRQRQHPPQLTTSQNTNRCPR